MESRGEESGEGIPRAPGYRLVE
ncbi:hypothetical protein A2U01_0111275, partial [Trifolium medium]|nr:hypothetical protein [Trifolium medium]